MEGRFTAIDLFCGAGGLSLGCENAGLSIVAAYDHWEPAIATYQHNFNHPILRTKIDETIELASADVIVGGPPCQGFSSAGLRRVDDHRNTLVRVFSEIVVRQKPKAFVFENVEGFLTGANGRFVFDLLEPVIDAGYRVHLRKFNAANFGVPQHRKRVIAIGGLGWEPSIPCPTHTAYGAPGAHLAGQHLPRTSTLLEALEGLLPPSSADSAEGDHVVLALKEDDLQRAKLLRPGQRMRDLPEEHWHQSYRRRAYRRVMDGIPSERRGGAPAGLRRLRGDEPSKAITGGALNEFLHPTEDRPLTIRECARLQTFPDSFRFVASPRDAIQLIGNAIPPRFADCLIRSLLKDLTKAEVGADDGKLLSFVPTLSSGMSPALYEVTEQIRVRFGLPDTCGQTRLQWS